CPASSTNGSSSKNVGVLRLFSCAHVSSLLRFLLMSEQPRLYLSDLIELYTRITLYIKGKVERMNKERTNIYLTVRQKKQLEQRSRREGLPMAETIRPALDVYLAWDDPTYQPLPSKPQTRKASSSPP